MNIFFSIVWSANFIYKSVFSKYLYLFSLIDFSFEKTIESMYKYLSYCSKYIFNLIFFSLLYVFAHSNEVISEYFSYNSKFVLFFFKIIFVILISGSTSKL